jgi:tRNA nucleotidyltransferase (CCA-adding enzyme)
MDVYLVGGAVRDKLLGLKPKEHDWVVVGSTPDEMLNLGYKQVGKDFPVFLHPETHDEYALARTERKTAPGYHGFEMFAAPDVTLEEDLLRRDLTVNAIAETTSGEIIDPYNGQQDLQAKVLRHVSPAFSEDPVRILRVARFAARFAHLDFTVASDTNDLMQTMVKAGEVDALVPERVWAETNKALGEQTPSRFFEVLRKCGALKKLFPEIDRLFGVPQPEKHHPEIDTGVHTMMVLEQAAKLSTDNEVRFAALLHDLGKGTTPKNEWPKHIAHEQRGVPLVKNLCNRYRVPGTYRELAELVTQYHLHYFRIGEMRPDTIVKTLEKLDAFRRPERFKQFLIACESDSRGRLGFEDKIPEQTEIISKVYQAAAKISTEALLGLGLSGAAIGKELQTLRVEAVTEALKQA